MSDIERASVSVAVILFIPSLLWHGYALHVVWGWFVSSQFDIQTITATQAAGLSLLAKAFTGFKIDDHGNFTDEEKLRKLTSSIASAIFIPAMVITTGWVIKTVIF